MNCGEQLQREERKLTKVPENNGKDKPKILELKQLFHEKKKKSQECMMPFAVLWYYIAVGIKRKAAI